MTNPAQRERGFCETCGQPIGSWNVSAYVPPPMVPCDDAAIERAARAIESATVLQVDARSLAEVALRAAGETP